MRRWTDVPVAAARSCVSWSSFAFRIFCGLLVFKKNFTQIATKNQPPENRCTFGWVQFMSRRLWGLQQKSWEDRRSSPVPAPFFFWFWFFWFFVCLVFGLRSSYWTWKYGDSRFDISLVRCIGLCERVSAILDASGAANGVYCQIELVAAFED